MPEIIRSAWWLGGQPFPDHPIERFPGDSSSVTIILVISLVNAGLLTFVESLGVILGSNIGTTVSSQIFASDFAAYAPMVLALGFLLHVFGRRQRMQHIGTAVLGLGLVFFGLQQIEHAVEPLRRHAQFREWLARMENPLLGAAAGALFTIVIQSSSATLGVVIALASQGLITLEAGVAVMLGAEVGTCADTLVATIGRARHAVRAGLFHLLFNVVTASVGIVLAPQLVAFARLLSGGASVERQVANAHVAFNVLGAVAAIGFVPWVARALTWMIPDREPASPPARSSDERENGERSTA